MPNDEVRELLAAADIGVAPYTALERFYFDPAKILEYLASGLAIIASDQGRVSDMLDNGRTGILIPPGDENALRDALVRLATDKSLRQKLGRASRRRAEFQHDWTRIAPNILAVLEEAIEQGARRN